jgi:putative ABC transport system ATP-binding protein
MSHAIAIRNVTKVYSAGAAQVRAVAGVSLNISPGEVVLLTGPSGSGKTTLLCIMGCILRPTSGSVAIRNQEVVGLSERELPRIRLERIGFVFQTFNLLPTLTAVENLEFALRLRGTPRREARRQAIAFLERVGLADKRLSLPRDLSAGQQQRVAIARALVGSPDIVLADEPTGSLDSENGRMVMDLLRTVAHSAGRAVIVVTHDIRLAEYADRILRMNDGIVTEVGKTAGGAQAA